MKRQVLTAAVMGCSALVAAAGQYTVVVESVVWPFEGAGFAAGVGQSLRDINGDGLPDVVRSVAGGVEYRLNTGNASFGPAVFAECLPSADVDHDGDMDCVLGLDVAGDATGRMDLRWREQDENGDFGAEQLLVLPAALDFSAEPRDEIVNGRVRVVDLNGDGFADIARSASGEAYSYSAGTTLDYILYSPATEVYSTTDSVFTPSSFTGFEVGPDLAGDEHRSLLIEYYDFFASKAGQGFVDFLPYAGAAYGALIPGVSPSVGDPFSSTSSGVLLAGEGDQLPLFLKFSREAEGSAPNADPVVGDVRRFVPEGTVSVGQMNLEMPAGEFYGFNIIGFEGIVDLTGLRFDPDMDGDQDVLLDVFFRRDISGAPIVERSVIFLNDGSNNFTGVVDIESVGAEPSDEPGEPGYVIEGTTIDMDGNGTPDMLTRGVAGEYIVSEIGLLLSSDLDGSGVVGSTDLAVLLAAWGEPGPTDIDTDGVTGASDLARLLDGWGVCE